MIINRNKQYIRHGAFVYPGISQPADKLASLNKNAIGSGEYSIYRGILVFWDNDYDARVLTFIDNNERVIPKMLAVSERKAYITVLWLGKIPNLPKELAVVNKAFPNLVEVAGDFWQVESFKTTSHIWLPILKEYMKQVKQTEV